MILLRRFGRPPPWAGRARTVSGDAARCAGTSGSVVCAMPPPAQGRTHLDPSPDRRGHGAGSSDHVIGAGQSRALHETVVSFGHQVVRAVLSHVERRVPVARWSAASVRSFLLSLQVGAEGTTARDQTAAEGSLVAIVLLQGTLEAPARGRQRLDE